MVHTPVQPEILSEVPALLATLPSAQISAEYLHVYVFQRFFVHSSVGGHYGLSTISTDSQTEVAFCDSGVKQHQTHGPRASFT